VFVCFGSCCRNLINDSYRLHMCMLYPPYLIALAAVYTACAYVKRDVTEWFDLLNVNPVEVRRFPEALFAAPVICSGDCVDASLLCDGAVTRCLRGRRWRSL